MMDFLFHLFLIYFFLELVERPFIQLSGDVPKPVTEEDDAKMEEDSEPLVAEVSLPLG